MGAETDRTRTDWRFVVVVILLATLLRFFRLGADSLWIDEHFTWLMVNPGPGHGLWEQFRDNIQGPLYLAALWPLVRDHASEWLMRLPAAIAGVAAVPLMLRLGAELDSPRAGRWAALLLALNPFHLWYSQEARGYAFLILFALAATVLLVRMILRGATWRCAVGYGLVAGLAVLSNMSALFLFVGHGLAVLLVAHPWRRGRRGPWLTAFGILGLVSLPWLLQAAGYWYPGRLTAAAAGLQPAGNDSLNVWAYPFTLFSFFYGFTLGPTLTELHRPDRLVLLKGSLPLLAPAGLAAGALLLYGLARMKTWVRTSWLLWLTVPVIILTVLRLADVKTFTPRYLAALVPLVVFAAALGLTRLPRTAGAILGTVWLVLTAWSAANYHLAPRYARDDVRAAAEWIRDHGSPGEPVLVPVVTNVFEHYYRGGNEVKDFWACPQVSDAQEARREIRARVDGARGAWLVLSRIEALDPGHHLETAFRSLDPGILDIDFPGVTVLRATDLTARDDDPEAVP